MGAPGAQHQIGRRRRKFSSLDRIDRREQALLSVGQGDIRASLEAVRDRLAEEIDTARYAKDVPPLVQRLVDVIERLEKLPDSGQVDTVDEFTARRERRRAAAREAAAGS